MNKLPSPAVRRCNSFCFYGIAAAMGLRHTNGNIGVTISNIRPECFSFSLPLLQFQKRFLASSANKAFGIDHPSRFSPLLRPDLGELAKPDTIKIPPHSGGYFSFGHSPNNTSGAQVRIKRLPACAHYLLPVNGSRGSNILNWSASLSLFSWSAMYSVIAFVFFPTVST